MKKILTAIMKWIFLALFVAAMVFGLLAVRGVSTLHLPQVESQKAELAT